MSFLAKFFQAGGEEAMDKLTTALVIHAPNLGGKAQLAGEDEGLTDSAKTVQDFKAALRDATIENDRIHQQYSELMGAAEHLQNQIADPNTPADKKASLTTSLNNLLGKIEHILPTVDRDQQRVETLTRQVHDAEQAFKRRASDAVHMSTDLEEQKHDLAAAQLAKDTAQRDAELASKLAGLSSGPHITVNAATEALRKATETAQKEADALNLKAQTLRDAKSETADDPNIQEALAAVKGTSSPASLSDRLASLRR